MRDAFARELEVIAAQDERVVLLTGDIGNRMFDRFRARFDGRFYNCGVAEANMMSVAAGLALCGLRPVVYTMVPFVTTRCLEQIRVDVCYHRSPVTIVGVGGGLCYASLGATHHSCEDIGFLRMLPEMSVVCPGDAHEVRAALRAAVNLSTPVYLRLGKKGEPVVHATPPDLQIGRGLVLRDGKDVGLLSTGNMLPAAMELAQELSTANIHAGVVSLHTVKPLDEPLLGRLFRECRLVVSLEEHSVLGGLGGAVAEWLAEQANVRARFLRLGTRDEFMHQVGSQSYARQQFGLDGPSLARRVREAFVCADRGEPLS
ncbi:MAG: transketolase family protein [Pirellulaceae bacterium]